MDKLIIKKKKTKRIPQNNIIIKISNEASEMLDDICSRSGKTKLYVASCFIEYAYKHCEIVEVDEEDDCYDI